ncbi:MAG TPA: YceI family protein [Chitinophagaceae bacterium]|nr:YceI family protein [Chitinophagaceae bacterium]
MKKASYSLPFLAAAMLVITAFTPITGKKTAPAATKWTLDKSHSSVSFSVSHMVVSETEGNFKLFDGTMENSKADFSDARISFTVDVNSINTGNDARDGHLKGDDFFNAEKYPAIKFVSTSFKPAGGKNYKLTGNLTIQDITKAVTFNVIYGGTINTGKGMKAGFKGTTTINRFDYNLKWNKTTEAGGLMVGQDVDITVKVELNEVK